MRGSVIATPTGSAPDSASSRDSSNLILSVLRRRSDFVRVQKSALRWVTPAFVVACEKPAADTVSIDTVHTGMTITKKIGNAVVRNRIRRRLRHVFKETLPALNLNGWTVILMARSDALTRDYTDLVRDLRWALRKIQEGPAVQAPSQTASSTDA